MGDFNFDLDIIWKNLHFLGWGLAKTLEFTSICIIMGSALGFVLALMGNSRRTMLRGIYIAYLEIFRGTPTLIQLFWIFYCLPLIIGVSVSNFASSVIALTLYMAAISSATFVSALKSIPAEHHDASVALGLAGWNKIRYVIFPQAARLATPNLLSNAVSLFKESSLVSAVGMADLMYMGQSISNRTARPLEILTAIAVVYFLVAFPTTQVVNLLERRSRLAQGDFIKN